MGSFADSRSGGRREARKKVGLVRDPIATSRLYRNVTRPRFVLALLVLTGACGKDAATKMCLEDFEKFEKAASAKDEAAKDLAAPTYQSCGIACDVTKDEDACNAFKGVTETMCSELGKESCTKLCEGAEGDETNEYACAKAKSM